MINYDRDYTATFIGKREYCGVKKKKQYTISVKEHKPYGVLLSVSNETISTNIPYCNINSIERSWLVV